MFVFGGDMPILNKKFIIRQINYFLRNKYDILVPKVDQHNEPLHAIYTTSIIKSLEEYLAAECNNAVMEFIKLQKVGFMSFKASEKTRLAFTNINTPSDIRIVEKILISGPKVSQRK